MNYRLILMRHAKSDWGTQAATDHARPLNARGRRDAPRIAQRLAELNWLPDYVLSSDAQRTRETWQLMAPHMPADVMDRAVVDFQRALYLAGREQLEKVAGTLGDNVGCVLALGHNPGWEEAACWLSGQSLTMATACAALLRTQAPSWRVAIGKRAGWQLEDFLRPKELAEDVI